MFQELLAKLASALAEGGFSYMVIGGQAVLLYGEPRLTKDIDVTVGADPGQLPKLLSVVAAVGLEVLTEQPSNFVHQTMVLPCLDPQSGIRVDFILATSPYERQALQRVRRILIGGKEVAFASVEDLVIHKLVAGRTRDLEDVKAVLIKNRNLDPVYIREWLDQFEKALAEPFRERFEHLWGEA